VKDFTFLSQSITLKESCLNRKADARTLKMEEVERQGQAGIVELMVMAPEMPL